MRRSGLTRATWRSVRPVNNPAHGDLELVEHLGLEPSSAVLPGRPAYPARTPLMDWALMVAEAGFEPAPDRAHEAPALPAELLRVAMSVVPRAGFEPAPPDLKDRCPWPLDERGGSV
jgi:hypothetical protein